MKEEFLQWLWKNCYYSSLLEAGDSSGNLEVLYPGDYNNDSGPDFFNTRLIISGTQWAGNTEVHINSSDWFRHGHHTDHSYDNVILHVVYHNDADAFTASGRRLTSVEVRFDSTMWDNYLSLVNSPNVFACSEYLGNIDHLFLHRWLHLLGEERLRRKSSDVSVVMSQTGDDWEETLYRMISRYFGYRVNTDPFSMLATRLPLRVLRKHADSLVQTEALLFGTAGMLDPVLFDEAVSDEYYQLLSREFRILSVKYSLQPLDGWIWKFHRLRPANFPTLRISQLAALLSSTSGLFSSVLNCSTVDELRSLFSVKASGYWDSHYSFGHESRNKSKNAGDKSVDLILINAIAPLLYHYGKQKGLNEWCELSEELLETLPSENNRLISDYTSAGIMSESAFISQALIELRSHYCRCHMCLECHIGAKLIASGDEIRRSESLFMEP